MEALSVFPAEGQPAEHLSNDSAQRLDEEGDRRASGHSDDVLQEVRELARNLEPLIEVRDLGQRIEAQLSGLAGTLDNQHRALEATSREAHDRSDAALEGSLELARRFETIAEFRDVARRTEKQLSVLDTLVEQCQRLEAASREAQDRSDAALRTAQEVGQRLEPLVEVRDLGQRIEAQLSALAGTLDNQHRALEATSREARDRSEALREASFEVVRQFETIVEVRDVGRRTEKQLSVLDTLVEQCQRLEAASREAQDRSDAALRTAQEVAQRLEPLAEVRDFGRRTDDQLTNLSKLARDFARRVEALERQNASLEQRIAALALQRAELKTFARELARVSKIERLVSVLIADVRGLRRREAVGATQFAGPPPAPDSSNDHPLYVPAPPFTTLSNRWRGFAANVGSVARGRLVRHRPALVTVVGVLVAAVSVVLISTGRGQVVPGREPIVSLPSPAAAPNVDPSASAAPQPTNVPPIVGGDPTPPAIEAQLKPESRVESPAKPRSEAVTTTAPTTPVAGPRFVGTLSVQSDPPGANVLVDGQLVGKTPVELSNFPAGSHVVWIEREGYRRWTSAAQLTANQTTRISTTLEANSER